MNSIDGDGALIKQLKFIAQGIVVISNASEPLTLLKDFALRNGVQVRKNNCFKNVLRHGTDTIKQIARKSLTKDVPMYSQECY